MTDGARDYSQYENKEKKREKKVIHLSTSFIIKTKNTEFEFDILGVVVVFAIGAYVVSRILNLF